jgi:hypothetical protein
MQKKIAILVHMDFRLLKDLNEASSVLGMPRAELIRRCLRRDIKFVREVEIETLIASQQLSSGAYGNYVQSTGLELG